MADIPILSSIFGSKPQIADYTPIDFSQEQLDALLGDLSAFPQISALGADFQKSYLSELNTAIPGFSDILAEGGSLTKQMENIAGTELSGQIPPDVAAQVQRTSAFQNLVSGAGGGMANANTARNYGLTSLDLINQGANLAGEAGNSAQRWAGVSGAGAAAQVEAGAIVTPQQRAQLDMQQNLIKQSVQQAKFNVAAAPNPIMKGLSDIVENLTAAYLGGKVGTIGAGNQAATNATAANMPTLDANYAAAGSPTPVFGDSGYPSAIPVDGYGGAGGMAPGILNDTAPLPVDGKDLSYLSPDGSGTDLSSLLSMLSNQNNMYGVSAFNA